MHCSLLWRRPALVAALTGQGALLFDILAARVRSGEVKAIAESGNNIN
jgi:hypothetical protein